MAEYITVQTRVPFERITCLLVDAFEGGSNYWYRIEEFKAPKNFKNSEKGDSTYRHMSYPVNEGGGVLVSNYKLSGGKEGAEDYLGEGEDEYKEKWVNLESIKAGIKIMEAKYPTHFRDMMSENDDAITGDVFLQCIVFGEVIYG